MGLIAVADSGLQIGAGGGHPDTEIRGGFLKNFFRPFRPQFGPKITGRPRGPWAPPLDPPQNCQPNLKIVSRSYRFSNNTKHWKKTEPLWVGPWVAGLLCRNSKLITNAVTNMFTYISKRICFSFHFSRADESNMLRTFPLYQLYLQIPRHHRHKRPLAQLQQVSDVNR